MTYADIIDEILKKLIYKGKGIEVNTAGLYKGLGTTNPETSIVKRYRELGGDIITIGSDAHTVKNLGYGFDSIPAMLNSCGFKYYNIFKNRKPEKIYL
jgi:histidinol-phosphatase (PHP family)